MNISTGEALIGGSEGGTQGGYYGRLISTTNLAIATANPTNPRIDTVSLTIADNGYTEPSGVSGNALVPLVTTGTPTSGANLTNLSGKAALPASSLLLGYVLVPAGASNIITADIANKATVVPLLGGSNYLQLLSSQKLQLVLLAGTVTWPAGSFLSNVLTIAHGLGRTPTAVAPVVLGNNSVGVACMAWLSGAGVDATNVYIGARTSNDTNPGSGATAPIGCIVIG